jgi:hypothetical protein
VTLEADILSDCELFDAVQTVTLTLLDGTTESVAYVTTSKLTKEQTRQYGPVGFDDEIRNYSLPVNELTSKVPEQDCTITDASGLVWKIKSVEKRTVGTRYLCMCVKTRAEYEAVLIPTGLAAAVTSETQINLTWTDNSNNETAFDVQRSTDNSTWTTINSPAAGSTSYSSTGLTAGTLYYFRLRARNAWNQSDWTSSVSKRTWLIAPYVYSATFNANGNINGAGSFPANNSNIFIYAVDSLGVSRITSLQSMQVGSHISFAGTFGTKRFAVTGVFGDLTTYFNYELSTVSGSMTEPALGDPVAVTLIFNP